VTLAARGTAWLNRKERAAAGVPVIYSREGFPDLPLTAVVGQPLPEVSIPGVGTGNSLPVRVEATHRDFLITAAALTLGGNAVEPKVGDRIADAAGQKWECCRRGTEPAWRYSDTERTTFRIHTKPVV
jgi:hypothetical protein